MKSEISVFENNIYENGMELIEYQQLVTIAMEYDGW